MTEFIEKYAKAHNVAVFMWSGDKPKPENNEGVYYFTSDEVRELIKYSER